MNFKKNCEELMASVIIPAYNAAAFLEECIDSVLNQTLSGFEIIVVDDGSTDYTNDILKKYLDAIIWIRQDNQGPSAARNRGIEMSRGKYLCFLDSDDRYKPERLEKLVKFLEAYPALGYAFSDLELFENDETVEKSLIDRWGKEFYSIGHQKIEQEKRIFTSALTPFLIKQRSFIHTSTITIRRSVLPKKPWFHAGFHYGEDAEFWARIAYRSTGGYIDEVLSEKRVVGNSLTHDDSRNLRNIRDLIGLRELQKSYYDSDKNIMKIINRQLLDYATSYCWWLVESGQRAEARKSLVKYWKKYPFSFKLHKVMAKHLIQQVMNCKRNKSRNEGFR